MVLKQYLHVTRPPQAHIVLNATAHVEGLLALVSAARHAAPVVRVAETALLVPALLRNVVVVDEVAIVGIMEED